MEPSVIVAVVAAVIAFASLAFAIYKHFTTRSFSRVAYEISQVADYGVPVSFLAGVSSAPVSVKFESVGTKKAENIILTLETRSDINNFTATPDNVKLAKKADRHLRVAVPTLNPTQSVRVFLNCKGNPAEDQVDKFELTHAEGAAVNKKAPGFTKARFHLPLIDLELDVLTKSLRLVRLGPWSVK